MWPASALAATVAGEARKTWLSLCPIRPGKFRLLLPVVLLASIQGSVVGLALVAIGKAQPGPPPDAPAEGDDDAWVPPRNAVPFGPFLALGAVEWLWLSDRLAALAPPLDVFR
jgi:leader peptidase (prepilin peptidase)/N-methyltransferase